MRRRFAAVLIYVVLLIGRAATRHQYGISAVVSQTSGVAECRLLSQALCFTSLSHHTLVKHLYTAVTCVSRQLS